ncbi:MAG TPA: glycosyltransferase family 4 protein, partial [Steroidobacteraceae bacterium]
AAHVFSYLALRRLYRSADAVVTYGPHVSAYVKARGARNVHVAAQAVDNAFWGSPETSPPTHGTWPEGTAVKFLFAGRPSREKGLQVLLRAWRASGLTTSSAALVLVGVRSVPPWIHAGGAADIFEEKVICAGELDPVAMRNFYGAADVLVLPSIATRTFREPWGLVINEAMNQHLPVIASDAVGAVAGGLVRPSHNGLVVAGGDVAGLAAAMKRLAEDPHARACMGEQGARDVQAYTYQAWARGFSDALHSLHLSRRGW